MDEIKNVLNELIEIEGVRQVQAVNEKNEEISRVIHKSHDYMDVMEVLKKMKEFSIDVVEKAFKKEGLRNIFLSVKDISLNFYFFKNHICLIIISDEKANLGKIRLVIRKNEEALSRN